MSVFVAIDLGQHLGYAVFDGLTLCECQTVNLPRAATKKNTLVARRYMAVRDLLGKLKLNYPGLEDVLYEHSNWFPGAKPGDSPAKQRIREAQNRVIQRSLGRLEGIFEAACVELSLKLIAVNVSDAKKALTGKKNADKATVRRTVLVLYPELKDHSQDAIDSVSVASFRLAALDPMWSTKMADLALVRRRKTLKGG